jgi:hypothetical protein
MGFWNVLGGIGQEAGNVGQGQQLAIERARQRQQDLETSMRNALENRRLQMEMQYYPQEIEERQQEMNLRQQEFQNRLKQQGLIQPVGGLVRSGGKTWQGYYNPATGKITYEPAGIQEDSPAEQKVADDMEILRKHGQPWDGKSALTPIQEQILEMAGTHFPAAKGTDLQKFEDQKAMLKLTPPPKGFKSWDEPGAQAILNQRALENVNRTEAARAGIYFSRPRAAGAGGPDTSGLTTAEMREYKVAIAPIERQINIADASKKMADARAWAAGTNPNVDPTQVAVIVGAAQAESARQQATIDGLLGQEGKILEQIKGRRQLKVPGPTKPPVPVGAAIRGDIPQDTTQSNYGATIDKEITSRTQQPPPTGGVNVLAPDGKTIYTFPTMEAANAYMQAAGMK